jgi:hypothetical protein
MSTNVFISSTGRDLGPYREAAIETCNRLGFIPNAMEFFEAMGVGATEGSRRKIDEADLYIGIFAHRYGYIEDGYTQSVTEVEFDYAGSKGLDRLCFLVDETYPWPPDAWDYKNTEALKKFKRRIDGSLIRAQFTDVNDFRAKLMQALVKWRDDHPDKGAAAANGSDKLSLPSSSSAPPLPSLLVGREEDLEKLKKRFGVWDPGYRQLLTVVRGWPGVGKTTLVTALAYDEQVLKAFPDGILWASVGENPDPFSRLAAWGHTLGVSDVGRAKTLEDAIAMLRAILRNKRVLLIVDDVWEAENAEPFKVAGPDCCMVITTRFRDVAQELAPIPDDIYVLEQLNEDKGLELLTAMSPRVVGQHLPAARQLVLDLEGLPLAIRVAGRLLEAEASLGFDVTSLFTELSSSSKILHAKAPEDRFDPKTGTTPTIDLLLRKSTERLDQETRDAFAFLGAFAPKPATFDLDAMKGVWLVDDPKPIARKLADRGLLEPIIGTGRFQMHAVLVMHARSLLEDDEE